MATFSKCKSKTHEASSRAGGERGGGASPLPIPSPQGRENVILPPSPFPLPPHYHHHQKPKRMGHPQPPCDLPKHSQNNRGRWAAAAPPAPQRQGGAGVPHARDRLHHKPCPRGVLCVQVAPALLTAASASSWPPPLPKLDLASLPPSPSFH